MLPKRLYALCLFLAFSSVGLPQGNKVVVVPLAGDAPTAQHVSLGQRTFADFSGCESEIFATPARPTQVVAEARGSILLLIDHDSWFASPRFRQDGGEWTAFPVNQINLSGGSANQWSLSTNAKVLELQPNSHYQFRVDYFTAPRIPTPFALYC